MAVGTKASKLDCIEVYQRIWVSDTGYRGQSAGVYISAWVSDKGYRVYGIVPVSNTMYRDYLKGMYTGVLISNTR